MYKVVSANDPNIVFSKSVILDTAIQKAKEESKGITFNVLVLDSNRRVRGYASKGRYLWGLPCKICDGTLTYPVSTACPSCKGWGVTTDNSMNYV